MKRRSLLSCFFLLTVTASICVQAQTFVSIEGASAWQSRNDQRIPGDTGTDFSIADFGKGPLPAYRIYVGHIWNKRHELRGLYAPFETELTGRFGVLLGRGVAAADGELGEEVIGELLAHTRVQFSRTTEHALAQVDRERLQTLDGQPLDAGTPTALAETIDGEDFAVVFALHRRVSGGDATRHGALARYQHVLLDEAQELAPIELELLGRAVAPDGSVTVAGDGNQQVDEGTRFRGWSAAMTELGQAEHTAVTLAHSYRCPPAIEALAR